MKGINTMKKLYSLIVILIASFTFSTGCLIDDSPVAVNTYSISEINSPASKYTISGIETGMKVHIGHDLPVTVTMSAEYNEDDVPMQFYLLNKTDVDEVEAGIGSIGDIRMYFIDRTQDTTIEHLLAGENTYQLVINIPANDARDEMTGDLMIGEYYVVCEVNKNEDAEIDPWIVYNKFDSIINPDNIIYVTSDYMSKPDLSIVAMDFTGGEEEPGDVLTFLDLLLDSLPGWDQVQFDSLPAINPIRITPSKADRTFIGTVQVRSSSSDALNVPMTFYMTNGTINIPLKIYDLDMGGYVDKYYIPILKANVTERVSIALMIPDDHDGTYLYPNYDAWPSSPSGALIAAYPVSAIRHTLPDYEGDKSIYKDYTWTIHAHVNPDGTITEKRFIDGQQGTYNNSGEANSEGNNELDQDMSIAFDYMEVEPNEGITVYPYDKMTGPGDTRAESDKQLVIFWDGLGWKVGDNTFGAQASIHEGAFFHNFSLYSLGVDVHGTVFNNNFYLVNAYCNAVCFPHDSGHTQFDIYVEAKRQVYFSDGGKGFSRNTWEYPITLYSKEYEKTKWIKCFKFTIKAGLDVVFTPGINLDLNIDGSLKMDKSASVVLSVFGDASISLLGLAGVGIYTYLDVLKLELIQSTRTETEYETPADELNSNIRGYLYRDVGIYLTGPTGYIDLYLEVNYLFDTKRWSWEIYSFSCDRVPIINFPLDDNNGARTTWMQYYHP